MAVTLASRQPRHPRWQARAGSDPAAGLCVVRGRSRDPDRWRDKGGDTARWSHGCPASRSAATGSPACRAPGAARCGRGGRRPTDPGAARSLEPSLGLGPVASALLQERTYPRQKGMQGAIALSLVPQRLAVEGRHDLSAEQAHRPQDLVLLQVRPMRPQANHPAAALQQPGATTASGLTQQYQEPSQKWTERRSARARDYRRRPAHLLGSGRVRSLATVTGPHRASPGPFSPAGNDHANKRLMLRGRTSPRSDAAHQDDLGHAPERVRQPLERAAGTCPQVARRTSRV